MRKYIIEKTKKNHNKGKNLFPNLKIKLITISLVCLLIFSGILLLFFSRENFLLKRQEAKYQEIITMQSEVINKTSTLNQKKVLEINKINIYLSEIDKFATKIASFLKIKKPSAVQNTSSSSTIAEKTVNSSAISSRSTNGITDRSSSGIDPLISKSELLASTLKQFEASASNYEISKNGIPSIWPLQGIITSNFGVRQDPLNPSRIEMHEGIDIAAYYGAPIRAAASGVVIQSGFNGTYGISCTINHENGYKTLYGHMSKIVVNVSDRVIKGQIIGYEGNTGKTTGPHLHYEVRLNDLAIDPLKFLP